MAKVKQVNRIESIIINLENSLSLAKEEYTSHPTNPLNSIITNLELTMMEINKLTVANKTSF